MITNISKYNVDFYFAAFESGCFTFASIESARSNNRFSPIWRPGVGGILLLSHLTESKKNIFWYFFLIFQSKLSEFFFSPHQYCSKFHLVFSIFVVENFELLKYFFNFEYHSQKRVRAGQYAVGGAPELVHQR